MDLCLVSMGTSLSSFGFVTASIACPDSTWQKCLVSSLVGLARSTITRYRKECDLRVCYVCAQENQDLGSACPEMNRTATPGRVPHPTCPDDDRPAREGCPECSIAYVLATSGTTGTPRLVHVPHCSIVPNIVDLRSRFSITPDDVIFNAAPLTFDPSIVEV